MTCNAGRLEAQIVFTTDQTFEFQWKPPGDVPITSMRTVSAGAYFPSELVAEFEGQLFGPSGTTVTLDDGELGSGRVTIALDPIYVLWHIDWMTATDLRDALGFDNTVFIAAPDVSATGTGSARGVWIAETLGKFSKHGDYDPGKLTTDFRQTVGPTGTVHALTSSSYRVHETIRWEGVPAKRAKQHQESIPFESFESFFQDVALGRVSYIPVNTLVRLIWNTEDDPFLEQWAEGHILWPATHDPEPMILGWTGRYTIQLPPLVIETV